jgi:hypothetical protein
MILLNNDISSIPVAIEMGRLVFDNLKKVILYLMPVWISLINYYRNVDQSLIDRNVHAVHGSVQQRILGNADPSELLPSSMLLHHERRGDVHLLDV